VEFRRILLDGNVVDVVSTATPWSPPTAVASRPTPRRTSRRCRPPKFSAVTSTTSRACASSASSFRPLRPGSKSRCHRSTPTAAPWCDRRTAIISTTRARSPSSSVERHAISSWPTASYYIAGYTIANDFGLHDFRDTDAGSMLRVKGADTLCPLGPGVVTAWDFKQVDAHERQRRRAPRRLDRRDGLGHVLPRHRRRPTDHLGAGRRHPLWARPHTRVRSSRATSSPSRSRASGR
jgi:hypothetical protein